LLGFRIGVATYAIDKQLPLHKGRDKMEHCMFGESINELWCEERGGGMSDQCTREMDVNNFL